MPTALAVGGGQTRPVHTRTGARLLYPHAHGVRLVWRPRRGAAAMGVPEGWGLVEGTQQTVNVRTMGGQVVIKMA